ncbi:MAG: DUF883 family protein [Proteobacteria bacterium]|nr:DUF883 family protein [Pseudomonadota bacterium]
MVDKIDTGRLADDLRALVADAEALLKASLNIDGAALNERAQAGVRELRARLNSLQDQLGERAGEVDDYVRENPWQTLAVVGGVALLLGLILGRRQ